MSLQRSLKGLNGITFPDVSRQCIPERWSNIPEGSLTVLFYLRISWPRNIKERSWSRSERARGGVEMKELRGVERSVSMNWQMHGRKNLWWMQSWMGSQWSCLRIGVMWSVSLHIWVLAAAFCAACRCLICVLGKPARILLQYSPALTELVRQQYCLQLCEWGMNKLCSKICHERSRTWQWLRHDQKKEQHPKSLQGFSLHWRMEWMLHQRKAFNRNTLPPRWRPAQKYLSFVLIKL